MSIHKITDFDIFFLSYDEPNAEKNWAWLSKHFPTAKRVHGVTGFDAAHKECAKQSTTDRLITIDGDNRINPDFMDIEVVIPEAEQSYVYSWAGKNSVNGLCYGNGGIKLWPKSAIENMKSHENAELDHATTDFCWDLLYYQMPHSYSDTIINASPYQAFRSGFREGLKLSQIKGKTISRRSLQDISGENAKRLRIWSSIGNDVKNGDWAMLGARMGCVELMTNNFKEANISDYYWFANFWKNIETDFNTIKKRNAEIKRLGDIMRNDLHIEVAEMDKIQSKFFKSVWINPERSGLM